LKFFKRYFSKKSRISAELFIFWSDCVYILIHVANLHEFWKYATRILMLEKIFFISIIKPNCQKKTSPTKMAGNS